jgi:hypothetical protein
MMSQATQNRQMTRKPSGGDGKPMSERMEEESGDFQQLMESVCGSVKDYSDKHPAVLATTIFLAGFYLGWKIKPW